MKKKRQKIYDKTGGFCYYCGDPLPKRWHADHVKPVRRHRGKMERPENDTMENMVPACPPCNLRKDTLTPEKFKYEIEQQVRRLKRDSAAFRLALKYGLIEETNKSVKFFFEKEN